jgi:serine/threonine-protein kinase
VTQTGLSLGTPQYMSPEQAAGNRTIDARTDIYSLGAITYEMLSGEPPHPGLTPHAVVTRLLSAEPDPLSLLRRTIPPHVEAAVQRALQKLPADRFQRAAHFADALNNPSFVFPATGARTAAIPVGAPLRPRWWWPAVAASLVTAGLGGWLLRAVLLPAHDRPARPPAVFRLDTDANPPVPGYPALSPDGKVLVYPVGDQGARQLVRRPLNNPAASPVPGTEDALNAFFSPDGTWVGFLADQSLKKVRLEDGTEALIAPFVENIAGASWREDDTVVFAALPQGGLFEVPAKSNEPRPVVAGSRALDAGCYFPHYLPGDAALLYNTQVGGGEIGVVDLKTGRTKTFGRGLRPMYIDSGHIVFATPEGRLAIQPFDVRTLDVTGTATILPETLGVGLGRAFHATSRTGVLAIIRAGGTGLDLALFDRTGAQQVLLRSGGFWSPRFSPDGRRIAFGDRNPDDLWLYNIATKSRQRLTTDGKGNNDPAWSPDGARLVFAADRPTRKDLVVGAPDDTGGESRLLVKEGLQWPSDWTSTGLIVFTDVPPDEDRDIWIVKADGSAAPTPYLDTAFIEKSGDVSPDGRWMAYDSNAPGRFEVFVDTFPVPSGAPVLVSASGGRNPRWGPGGRELFYWEDDRLVAARVDLSAGARVLGRTTLFQAGYAGADHANYDVSPDGTSFAVVIGRARPQQILVAIDALSPGAR